MFTWKYGLIKVAEEGNEDIYHLVELFSDEEGNYTSFCDARIISVVELTNAHNDVQRDGVNTWFFDNGVFTREEASVPGDASGRWDWASLKTKKKPPEHTTEKQ